MYYFVNVKLYCATTQMATEVEAVLSLGEPTKCSVFRDCTWKEYIIILTRH